MKVIIVPPVITLEQAQAEGVGAFELLSAADWHKAMANQASGLEKERHFAIAGKLKMVAIAVEGGPVRTLAGPQLTTAS